MSTWFKVFIVLVSLALFAYVLLAYQMLEKTRPIQEETQLRQCLKDIVTSNRSVPSARQVASATAERVPNCSGLEQRYVLTYHVDPAKQTLSVTAIPKDWSRNRSYFIDGSGKLRYEAQRPATAESTAIE